eukprot:gene1282-423_t
MVGLLVNVSVPVPVFACHEVLLSPVALWTGSSCFAIAMQDEQLSWMIPVFVRLARRNDFQDSSGWTPLFYSVWCHTSQYVHSTDYQCQECPDTHTETLDRPEEPAWAKKIGHSYLDRRRAACISALVTWGADLNARDIRGATPLSVAASGNLPECVGKLLDAGANPDAVTEDSELPLHFASSAAASACLSALLAKTASPDKASAHGITPLMEAAAAGSPSCIKALLQAKADPAKAAGPSDWADPNIRYTPLVFAAASGQLGAVMCLVSQASLADRRNALAVASSRPQRDRICSILSAARPRYDDSLAVANAKNGNHRLIKEVLQVAVEKGLAQAAQKGRPAGDSPPHVQVGQNPDIGSGVGVVGKIQENLPSAITSQTQTQTDSQHQQSVVEQLMGRR